MWQFDAYYHMNELIDHCNGRVDSDFQVQTTRDATRRLLFITFLIFSQLRDAAESQVTVTVPLYVSYVYVTAPRGWGALEHQTEMEVSFRYQNVLWRTGKRLLYDMLLTFIKKYSKLFKTNMPSIVVD